jgi:hypothetical protein
VIKYLSTTHPGFLLVVVGLFLLTSVLLARMGLHTKDSSLRLSLPGMNLAVFRGREKEDEPPQSRDRRQGRDRRRQGYDRRQGHDRRHGYDRRQGHDRRAAPPHE